VRITISQSTLSGDERPLDHWRVAAAILEQLEPGASTHCVEIINKPPLVGYPWNRTVVTHQRLNVEIDVTTPGVIPMR
jgi:hypothetical protein